MTEPLWTPSPDRIRAANITRFPEHIRRDCAPAVTTQQGLYRWSVEHPEKFWPQVWAYCGIKSSKSWDKVLEHGDRMPGAKWFTGSRLNFAENLLRYRDERTALVFRGEKGERVALTYKELYAQVAGCADALRKSGVVQGDRVAGFMPNRHETVIAMLAATSLGAVWSSCSPDFGITGVLDRFGQIAPKVLVTVDGYHYANKIIDSLERIRGVLERLPSVQQVVVVPYVSTAPDISRLPNAKLWADYLTDATEVQFEQLPFDHPIYIMYSSGTTGVPKCIVHGAGGTLIQHLKELALHTDVKREDVRVTAADLIQVPEGQITDQGLRLNVDVGIQYLESWLRGNGCVPIYNLMEDAATAEISRTQVWQWMHHGAQLSNGQKISAPMIRDTIKTQLAQIRVNVGDERYEKSKFPQAAQLFELMMVNPECKDFLTLEAYRYL